MKKDTRVRETIKCSRDDFGDFTDFGPWEYNGEVYKKIDDYLIGDCDGESHAVITLRKSDKKYFKHTWCRSDSGKYYFSDGLIEVFPKTVTKYE